MKKIQKLLLEVEAKWTKYISLHLSKYFWIISIGKIAYFKDQDLTFILNFLPLVSLWHRKHPINWLQCNPCKDNEIKKLKSAAKEVLCDHSFCKLLDQLIKTTLLEKRFLLNEKKILQGKMKPRQFKPDHYLPLHGLPLSNEHEQYVKWECY